MSVLIDEKQLGVYIQIEPEKAKELFNNNIAIFISNIKQQMDWLTDKEEIETAAISKTQLYFRVYTNGEIQSSLL